MTDPAAIGDPEAMRLLARELAARADLVGDTPSGFTAALDGATFEGAAAVRLRETATAARGRAADVATELREIATALNADATLVEQQIAEAQAATAAASPQDGWQAQ
jgi:hypothetical protein